MSPPSRPDEATSSPSEPPRPPEPGAPAPLGEPVAPEPDPRDLERRELEASAEVPAPEEPAATRPGPARAIPRPVTEAHLKGVLESLVFASDKPLAPAELARLTKAETRDVRRLLEELRAEYKPRGIQLEEVAGGWQFRSSAVNAPFVRELLQAKPVRLSRAQLETMAIVAYRQPVTRPEVDEVRGVDSGAALKVLLERDLVRMMGRKEDVGRPVLYGTTPGFLEFFGLRSLRELPTLREFTELSEESRSVLSETLGNGAAEPPPAQGPSPEAPEPEASGSTSEH